MAAFSGTEWLRFGRPGDFSQFFRSSLACPCCDRDRQGLYPVSVSTPGNRRGYRARRRRGGMGTRSRTLAPRGGRAGPRRRRESMGARPAWTKRQATALLLLARLARRSTGNEPWWQADLLAPPCTAAAASRLVGRLARADLGHVRARRPAWGEGNGYGSRTSTLGAHGSPVRPRSPRPCGTCVA